MPVVTRGMQVHYVLPDLQIQPNRSLRFVRAIAAHAKSCKPDVLVCLGDAYDMQSLSTYDAGKLAGEGTRYTADIDAGNTAMGYLEGIGKRRVFTLGNHEERIQRHVNANPQLVGKVGYDDLALDSWEVHDYLAPVTVHGVTYCHFFPRAADGRVMQNRNGAPNAKIQAAREMRTVTAGHKQGFDYAEHYAGGRLVQSMIVGSCYPYHLGYLSPQGQDHFRGVVIKRVYTGRKCYYDFERVSLDAIMRRYDGK